VRLIIFWVNQYVNTKSYTVYLDHKTASTIPTSIVHPKLDYCNSLYYNLPNTQLNRLQHIQNSLARAFISSPISTLLANLYTSLKLSSA